MDPGLLRGPPITVRYLRFGFLQIDPANSATSETVDAGREQEAREREVFRSGRSLTVIIVALVLAGMLHGATAATFWISHTASRVRQALEESRYLSVRGTC